MNVSSANDDEDFPVFRAGPPLPVRSRAKSCSKPKHVPLKATTLQMTNSTKPPLPNCVSTTATSTVSAVNSAESKVKQYIERVKASDELARKKRIKPEQMLTLEDLYQVKVSQKVEQTNPLCATEMHEKLRETLRIVKEKDELINKLRESCHDLAIKCADAENRVDELRFSYGRLSSSASDRKINHSRGSVCGELLINQQQQHPTIPRRCVSVENIFTSAGEPENGQSNDNKDKSKPMQDKSTETTNGVKHDAQTQIESLARGDWGCNGKTLSEQEVGDLHPDDEILMETCSNWLEKIQNWKTDSNFNLSQDSCGDRDSGFRGSAEIEMESSKKTRRASIPKSKKDHHGESFLRVPQKSTPPTAQIPQLSSSTTITEPGASHEAKESNIKTSQHFWPSFSTSHSHLKLNSLNYSSLHTDSIKSKSLFYEIAEAERNKNAHFKENGHQQMTASKSLDVLFMPRVLHHNPQDLKSLIDSSFDPPEFILKSHLKSQHRAIDKKMKILDPLLDDTTKIALRVKAKSERLAKMLRDACTFE